MPYAERNLPLSAALVACLGLFGLERPASAEELRIPGVDTGSDILRALALAYDGRARGELVLVPPASGTASALAEVIAGRAAFARIDRPLSPEERAAGLVARAIFTLPVFVLAHPDLNRPGLGADELAAILDGRIVNWAGLGGPRLPIRLVSRDGPPDNASTRRWARAARQAELVALVRRHPGTLGLSMMRPDPQDEPLILPIGGLEPRHPHYPRRVEMALAYRPEHRTPAFDAFLAFLASARAADLVAAYGGNLSGP